MDITYNSKAIYGRFFLLLLSLIIIPNVNMVALSIFDSPNTLKTTLATEASLEKQLRITLLKKKEEMNILRPGVSVRSPTRSIKIFYNKCHSSKVTNIFDQYKKTVSQFSKTQGSGKAQTLPNKHLLSDFNGQMFDGAVHGLLVINRIYGLNIEDTSNCSAEGPNEGQKRKYRIQQNQRLDVFDMVVLASRAIKLAWYGDSIRFLLLASEAIKKSFHDSIERSSINLNRIISFLSFVTQKRLSTQRNIEKIDLHSRHFLFITTREKEELKHRTTNVTLVKKVLTHERVVKVLCNGKYKKSVQFSNHSDYSLLKCTLVHNKYLYLRLGPFKFEVIHVDPFRAIIHDFLAPYEIEEITTDILPKLTSEQSKPLLIHSNLPEQSAIDNYKASSMYFDKLGMDKNEKEDCGQYNGSTFLEKEKFAVMQDHTLRCRKKLMVRISKKIELSTHLMFSNQKGNEGKFKASLYGLGGMTEQHSDSYGVEDEQDMSNVFKDFFNKSGDILATLLIWISDVEIGGGTYFCSSQSEDMILPIKGSALLWVNLNSTGSKHALQNHGGCPVAKGKKFVLTKWFYHYYQYKKFPCETKHDTSSNVHNMMHSIPNLISRSRFTLVEKKNPC